MSRTVLAFPKPVRLRDEDYLRFIKRQPCLITHCASEASHIVPEGHAKMGSKVSDYRTLPMHPKIHRLYHRVGRKAFEERFNVDLDLEQIHYLEIFISALRDGENLGAR